MADSAMASLCSMVRISMDFVLMDDLLSNVVRKDGVDRKCSDRYYQQHVQWEDFDTTGEVPLSNSLNIRLYSNSSSFDVVTVSAT
ncbi:hypothetical protein Tco_1509514 [Tanacetum coccineum]